MDVMGVRIETISAKELTKKLEALLFSDKVTSIGKVNTEFLYRAQKNAEFADTINGFDLNITDGRGVLWAARYLTLPTKNMFQAMWQLIYSGAAIIINPSFITIPIPENVPGVDALKLMIGVAQKVDAGVFFFGATQNDLEGAIKNLKQEMPELQVAGSLNGYDFQKDASIDPVTIINETKAKLLIVALGSPLQEYWIRDNVTKLKNIRVAVGEGGSLAFVAGSMKRAPKWMQKIGLEWLWRLFANRSLTHQTGSRFKRVWNAVPAFAYEVFRYKLKHIRNESKNK